MCLVSEVRARKSAAAAAAPFAAPDANDANDANANGQSGSKKLQAEATSRRKLGLCAVLAGQGMRNGGTP